MKIRILLSAALSTVLVMPALIHAQPIAAQASKMARAHVEIPPSQTLNALLSIMERQVVSAADAMPADKYNFAPTQGDFTGVRTFGEQVRHLAQANYAFFKGWGIPGEIDPKSLDNLKTKEQLMQALRNSYVFAHAAVDSITPENAFVALPGSESHKATRVSMAAFAAAHSMDHYGQMVEYLRMNGITPPASRSSH
jgi:uncharacterized damage-inducible protein DinB